MWVVESAWVGVGSGVVGVDGGVVGLGGGVVGVVLWAWAGWGCWSKRKCLTILFGPAKHTIHNNKTK